MFITYKIQMDYEQYIGYLNAEIIKLENEYQKTIDLCSDGIHFNKFENILKNKLKNEKLLDKSGIYPLNLDKYEEFKCYYTTNNFTTYIYCEKLIAFDDYIQRCGIINKKINDSCITIREQIKQYKDNLIIIEKTYSGLYEKYKKISAGHKLTFPKEIWNNIDKLYGYFDILERTYKIDWSISMNVLNIKTTKINTDLICQILEMFPNIVTINFECAELKKLVLDDIINIKQINTIIFAYDCDYNDLNLQYSGGTERKHIIVVEMLINPSIFQSNFCKMSMNNNNLIVNINFCKYMKK